MSNPAGQVSKRWPGAARGFTMIELIVVSVLLVVLAAVIAPRLVGGDAREARLTAVAVRDLLSAAGEREALTSQNVILSFDAEEGDGGRLSVLTAAPGGRPGPDALLPAISMGATEVERCEAAGVMLSPRRWQVPLREGEIRPAVALTLRHESGGRWMISLPSEAMGATMLEAPLDAAAARPLSSGPAPIDLDAAGGGDEPW
jgi:prepilin-type N-terminal cleavage/methylation domain-containing protein